VPTGGNRHILPRLAAGTVASLALYGALASGLADLALVHGDPQAAWMPLSSVHAAERTLGDSAEDRPELRALAMATLQRTLTSADAASWLAVQLSVTEPERAERILAGVGALGWHGEMTQRALFNRAMIAGNYDEGLDHADALLSQGKARDLFYAQFDLMSAEPSLRESMVRMFAAGPRWGSDYIVSHAANLDDGALVAYTKANLASGAPLDREQINAVLGGLVRAGRAEAALAIGGMLKDTTGLDRGALPWLSGQDRPGPFDWSLDPALNIDANGALVTAAWPQPGQAQRILGLRAGDYTLASAQREPRWRWQIRCSQTGEYLASGVIGQGEANFAVPDGCRIQTLIVTPMAGPAPEPLAPLAVERR
jgi:hypothetical protein